MGLDRPPFQYSQRPNLTVGSICKDDPHIAGSPCRSIDKADSQFLFLNRSKGTFASVAMMAFVLIVFSSITILNCETAPESNIKTASDALWWSFVTITTVGYGDFYPTTTLGRIIAVVLMTAGVGLFCTFTAYVASLFLQEEEKGQEKREDQILAELKSIRERLDRIEINTKK